MEQEISELFLCCLLYVQSPTKWLNICKENKKKMYLTTLLRWEKIINIKIYTNSSSSKDSVFCDAMLCCCVKCFLTLWRNTSHSSSFKTYDTHLPSEAVSHPERPESSITHCKNLRTHTVVLFVKLAPSCSEIVGICLINSKRKSLVKLNITVEPATWNNKITFICQGYRKFH
jgi:hypothetical protein